MLRSSGRLPSSTDKLETILKDCQVRLKNNFFSKARHTCLKLLFCYSQNPLQTINNMIISIIFRYSMDDFQYFETNWSNFEMSRLWFWVRLKEYCLFSEKFNWTIEKNYFQPKVMKSTGKKISLHV